MYEVVTPANAGVQGWGKQVRYWIPAFAGMTKPLDFIVPDQYLEIESLTNFIRRI